MTSNLTININFTTAIHPTPNNISAITISTPDGRIQIQPDQLEDLIVTLSRINDLITDLEAIMD